MTNRQTTQDPYFEAHVFCCTNERPAEHPRGSCKARGGEELREYMKAQAKARGLNDRVRINSSGCLDRCELGPCVVIYPDGIWYAYKNEADVDEILDRHIIGGEVVERLVIAPDQQPSSPVASPAENPAKLHLKISAIEDLTANIKRYVLVAEDGGELPPFQAGAHINIDTAIDVTRSYSLANDPAVRGHYEIAVKREVEGAGASGWMHDALQVGSVIEASAPANNFTLDQKAGAHILVAGGIGITPVLSMARQLMREGADFAFHYCATAAEDAAYVDEITKEFAERAHFHFDGGDPAKGIDLEKVLASQGDDTHLYVCGPGGLMDAVIDAARARNWSEDVIHYEFFTPKAAQNTEDDGSFTVRISSTGQELEVPSGQTILETLRANGLEVASACEGGICGTCKTTLLGGAADHRDQVLNEGEQSKNQSVILCVSRAQAGEVLVLDL